MQVVEKPKGVMALKTFFSQSAKEVSMMEMTAFWKSLTNEEKTEYVKAAEVAIA
jgi:hypothetical protein